MYTPFTKTCKAATADLRNAINALAVECNETTMGALVSAHAVAKLVLAETPIHSGMDWETRKDRAVLANLVNKGQ